MCVRAYVWTGLETRHTRNASNGNKATHQEVVVLDVRDATQVVPLVAVEEETGAGIHHSRTELDVYRRTNTTTGQ